LADTRGNGDDGVAGLEARFQQELTILRAEKCVLVDTGGLFLRSKIVNHTTRFRSSVGIYLCGMFATLLSKVGDDDKSRSQNG
jgi:hypothetical protein